MNDLERVVRANARYIVEEGGYQSPELAYSQCLSATGKLHEALDDQGVKCFGVEVKVKTSLEDTPWWADRHSILHPLNGVWHWIAFVPELGLVDCTGAQFGFTPLKIYKHSPRGWDLVRNVKWRDPTHNPRIPYGPSGKIPLTALWNLFENRYSQLDQLCTTSPITQSEREWREKEIV